MRSNMDDSQVKKQITIFYILAFAISWLIWSPLLFIPAMKDFAFLLYMGAYGPLIAGMLTTRLFGGGVGLKAWLKTIFKLRIGVRWYLAGILFLPMLIAVLHLALYAAIGGSFDLSSDPPWYWALGVFPLNVVLAVPLSSAFEEAGWQGFALPRLASRLHPFLANLLHGALWAAWHIPLYFTSEWKGNEPLALLIAYTIPLSVILFWLTRKSGGSAWPAIFLHQATNHYGSLFTSTMIFVGTMAANFTLIKTLIYWVIAAALLVASKGSLGYPAAAARHFRQISPESN